MEYYLVLKRNVPIGPKKAQRNLKCILLNEISQSKNITA
jgi:hypothetical protein